MNWGDTRLPARFWDKVIPEPNSGCWLWTAYCDERGYAKFQVESRKSTRGHRLTVLAEGRLIGALQIDHRCRTHCCVNPQHLDVVTQAENMKRRAIANTHCPAGHAYDERNTYFYRGWKHCRTCINERTRAHRTNQNQ